MHITLNNNGFTLIELMVTITIIAVVFGVVVSATKGIQQQGRDAQRKSDLGSIQSALQQYYVDQGFFPTMQRNAGFALDVNKDLNNCTGNPTAGCSSSKEYLSTIPHDTVYPITGNEHYCYEAYSNRSQAGLCNPADTSSACYCDNISVKCNYYYLYAHLEGSTTSYTCNPEDGPHDETYRVAAP